MHEIIFKIYFFFIRWCDLARWNNLTQTLIFIVEDVSVDEFEENTDIFAETFRIFEDGVEMSNPASDGFTLDLALAYVPISHQMKNRVMEGKNSWFSNDLKKMIMISLTTD